MAGSSVWSLCVLGLVSSAGQLFGQWTANGTSIYYNGGNVGVGTSSPGERLHIIGQGIRLDSLTGSGAWAQVQLFGPAAANARGWRITSDASGSFGLEALTNDSNLGLVDREMTVVRNGNVGIGTTNPVHMLQVAGTIGATEVIVSATGADYVFDPAYPLMPLGEVAAFIKANRHLPGIPSAAEVKEKGVSVGEMESKLLAKVEELTLQMIQMNEENKKLKERLEKLEKAK